MAAVVVAGVKDGPPGSVAAGLSRGNGALSFDPAAFRAYLQALLSPGKLYESPYRPELC